jgi:hypothetical protein
VSTQVVSIGIDPSVADWAPEAKYVLRALLRIAGMGWDFSWASGSSSFDIYYGPVRPDVSARMIIPAERIDPSAAAGSEPEAVEDFHGTPYLRFPDSLRQHGRFEQTQVVYPSDILAAGFWLLTGLREPAYRRDRRDNIDLDRTAFERLALFERPILSEQAEQMRRFLSPPPAAAPFPRGTLVLSHDVDYPEIIRWIEWARVIGEHGWSGLRHAAGILSGRTSYWQFGAWADLAERLGGRSTFYFMARRGSLWQYATGTPDAFYDINDQRFRRLFVELRERGCEIGLHASYHAHRGAETLAAERVALEAAAGTAVAGVRHHYWHLDPRDPNETLRRHDEAGFAYDSSLAFEFFPGFRRGVCHPFRAWDPGRRAEIDLIELPPTWMDDHFHHRLEKNRIQDPAAHAASLLRRVAAVGGVAVLDYHVRGMNREIFPAYGPWLEDFLEGNVPEGFIASTAAQAVDSFAARDAALRAASTDRTAIDTPERLS